LKIVILFRIPYTCTGICIYFIKKDFREEKSATTYRQGTAILCSTYCYVPIAPGKVTNWFILKSKSDTDRFTLLYISLVYYKNETSWTLKIDTMHIDTLQFLPREFWKFLNRCNYISTKLHHVICDLKYIINTNRWKR